MEMLTENRSNMQPTCTGGKREEKSQQYNFMNLITLLVCASSCVPKDVWLMHVYNRSAILFAKKLFFQFPGELLNFSNLWLDFWFLYEN